MTVHDRSARPPAGPDGEAEEITQAGEVQRRAGETGGVPPRPGDMPPTWTTPSPGRASRVGRARRAGRADSSVARHRRVEPGRRVAPGRVPARVPAREAIRCRRRWTD